MNARVEQRTGAGGLPAYVLRDGVAEVEVLPDRGALVSRYRVKNTDVLWLDEATVADQSKSVRGGIPLLFPNAGPLPEGVWAKGALPQHGFARRHRFRVSQAIADESTARVELELSAHDVSTDGYPFDFVATYALSLFDGTLLLEWALTNRGEVPLPWQFGLHPYFWAPRKEAASVDATGTKAWNNITKQQVPYKSPRFEAGEVDLHLLDPSTAGVTFERGDGRNVRLEWTEHFSTLVLWTLPDKPFVCVEPWTAPTGALATGDRLLHVAPGATQACAVTISCREARR